MLTTTFLTALTMPSLMNLSSINVYCLHVNEQDT